MTCAREHWRRAPRATRASLPGRSPPLRRGPAFAFQADPPSCCRDNLLTQQGAAQSLDQIERAALYFVRTVDRQIDLAMFAERGERNVRRLRLRRSALRGRNADKAQA